MRKLILFMWSVAAWSATTTVQQAIVGPDGQPASGTVNIRISAPCASGSDYVGAKTISRAFSGTLTIKLVPNDTCSPAGTSYTAGWTFSDGRALTQTWLVPASGSAVSVDSVVVPSAPAVLTAYTPTRHASTHASGASDAITIDKSQAGLSNVDNTSDANKPISTATAAALALKAPLASPAFTGNVTIGATILSSCTGVDDTAVIQTAMNATGAVELPPGTCVVSNLVPTRSVQIGGRGPLTVLSFKAGSTGWLIDGSTYGVRLAGLALDGGLSSTQAGTTSAGNRSGVQLNATVRDSGLYGVTVRGFSNIAVGLGGTSSLMQATPVLSNVNAYYNYIGIETRLGASGTAGEYSRITGCSITDNRYGLNIHSGNTMVVANTINNNGYNVSILADANGGHGILTGNTINHGTVNGLMVSGILASAGFTILGNQFFAGDWSIDSSNGISITDNTINVANIAYTNNGAGNVFARNYLPTAPALTGATTVTVVDNRVGDGTFLQSAVAISGVQSAAGVGSALLTNGNFASSTGWTLGTGWSIASNLATQSGSGTSALLYHALTSPPVDGTTYLITYTVSGASGSVQLKLGIGGSTESTTITSSNGTFSRTYLVPSHADSNLYLRNMSAIPFSLSNVSVQVAGVGATVSMMPPVSCTGLASGTLWNNAGVPAICP